MSAQLSGDAKRFLSKHWAAAYITIDEMRNMLEKDNWNVMETGGMGSALGDIYKVVEHSLKSIIEEIKGRKIPKNETWHQKLLEDGIEEGLVPEEIGKIIRGMLRYRHLDVHGYSMDTREDLIRKNVPEAIDAFCVFVSHLQKKFDITDADIRIKLEARRKQMP
jgi:hypothetical protein